MTMTPKPRIDFDSMPGPMRPQPLPGLPGCRVYASFSAMRELAEKTGIQSGPAIIGELLRANASVIEVAAGLMVLNPDGTRWTAGIDMLPLPIMQLATIFADAASRRLFGEPLEGAPEPDAAPQQEAA